MSMYLILRNAVIYAVCAAGLFLAANLSPLPWFAFGQAPDLVAGGAPALYVGVGYFSQIGFLVALALVLGHVVGLLRRLVANRRSTRPSTDGSE